MLKDLVKTQPIQLGNHRNALKAALRQIPTSFPPQHLLQALSGWQKVADVVGGIRQLDISEFVHPAPVTALGALVQLNTCLLYTSPSPRDS